MTVTAALVTRARALRADGSTIEVVAELLGLSQTSVWRYTQDAHQDWKAKRDERIRALRAEGLLIADISKAVGCCRETVRRALRTRKAA